MSHLLMSSDERDLAKVRIGDGIVQKAQLVSAQRHPLLDQCVFEQPQAFGPHSVQ